MAVGAGDAAFEAFYREARPKLVALAHLMGEADAALDLAQEAMLIASKKWARHLQDRSAGERYMYMKTVLVRLILHQRGTRRRYWGLLSRLATGAVIEVQAGSGSAESLMLGRLSPSKAMQALDALPPRQRIVMTLLAEGFTTAEIATIMRLTTSSVRSHRQAARTTLIRLLGTEGGRDD